VATGASFAPVKLLSVASAPMGYNRVCPIVRRVGNPPWPPPMHWNRQNNGTQAAFIRFHARRTIALF
jgi:hypothetical protein